MMGWPLSKCTRTPHIRSISPSHSTILALRAAQHVPQPTTTTNQGDRGARHASFASAALHPSCAPACIPEGSHTPAARSAAQTTTVYRTPGAPAKPYPLHMQHVVLPMTVLALRLDRHLRAAPLQTRDEGEARARLISPQVRGDYRARGKEALRAQSTAQLAAKLRSQDAWCMATERGAREEVADRRREPQDREWGVRRRGATQDRVSTCRGRRGYTAREQTHLVQTTLRHYTYASGFVASVLAQTHWRLRWHVRRRGRTHITSRRREEWARQAGNRRINRRYSGSLTPGSLTRTVVCAFRSGESASGAEYTFDVEPRQRRTGTPPMVAWYRVRLISAGVAGECAGSGLECVCSTLGSKVGENMAAVAECDAAVR
ncbi:hypothetical protein C8J57DRAFT_1608997 [Mycena rebaudengoi]|nr:hypothetical protein C8J57DRAFT_1608997 [Mycena rebaudengoi]